MWTCCGTRRITVASKRSGFPPLTFGALIWCSTTSTCGYICSFPLFASSIFTLETIVTPGGRGWGGLGGGGGWMFWFTLCCTPECCSRELGFHRVKYGCVVAPLPLPYAASHTLFSPWQPALLLPPLPVPSWALVGQDLAAAAAAALTHPRALTSPHVNTSPFHPPWVHSLFITPPPPQRWRWLCHCSWDQSAAGAHGNDHMEPTGHLQELLRNHRAAFPLWPAELQHEVGHLDLRWKPGRRQSCNITQTRNSPNHYTFCRLLQSKMIITIIAIRLMRIIRIASFQICMSVLNRGVLEKENVMN